MAIYWLLSVYGILAVSVSGAVETGAAIAPVPIPQVFLSDRDYPAAALKAHQEGRALVRLTIAKNGRPSDCKLVKSSGSTALDDASCKSTLHLRFQPARDENGKKVEGVFEMPVNWKIPAPR